MGGTYHWGKTVLSQGETQMSRILLTGMSGVGKSTVLKAMASEDTFCIDLDNSPWITSDPQSGERFILTAELTDWMKTQRCRNIVIAGCESNQKELYPALDAVIVMIAPLEVMQKRILARDNPFGKSDSDWQRIMRDKKQVEPLLTQNCTYVCDANRPLDAVLSDIFRYLDI